MITIRGANSALQAARRPNENLRLANGSVLKQINCEATLDADRRVQRLDTKRLETAKHAIPSRAEVSFGSFRLVPAQYLLLDGETPVSLGSRAMHILKVLVERPGELVTKKELMDRVWPDLCVQPASLGVHISALRRVLRDGRDGNRFIINIPGRGYCFVAPIRQVTD
jgi:DNA-binding winged helix-turn-helix (wHTH) protein